MDALKETDQRSENKAEEDSQRHWDEHLSPNI